MMTTNSITYINNFLIESLEYESSVDKISFSNTSLKTSYIIDISSYFISEYLFHKQVEFPTSSRILRDKYGAKYKYYIDYLIEKKIIYLKKKHLNGKNCRIYSLNLDLLKGEINYHQNADKILLKKYKNSLLNNFKDTKNQIDEDVKLKLINDLYKVDVDRTSSMALLSTHIGDREVYLKNKFSIASIINRNIFYCFDDYGRMHTNFTNLKSSIRKNSLMIDGKKTVEIDIKNSQPLFLTILLREYQDVYDFDISEIQIYYELTYTGKFYQYLIENTNIKTKDEVKNLVYKVLFGKNYKNSKEDQFQSLFPTIYSFIKFYKKVCGDYRYLSHKLQSLESNFIFNTVIRQIKDELPELPVITVHDSLICKDIDAQNVKNIFEKNFHKHFEFISERCSDSRFNIYSYG